MHHMVTIGSLRWYARAIWSRGGDPEKEMRTWRSVTLHELLIVPQLWLLDDPPSRPTWQFSEIYIIALGGANPPPGGIQSRFFKSRSCV